MSRLSERFIHYCELLGLKDDIRIEDLRHILNLIELEENGLLVKLPCKEGDKLYDIRQDNINNRKNDIVHELEICAVSIKFIPWESYIAKDVLLQEIGQTVFTTRSSAEYELKRWR